MDENYSTLAQAIAKSGFPSKTKHVLLVLSHYQNSMGMMIGVSWTAIAEDTGYTPEEAMEYASVAEKAGWGIGRPHVSEGEVLQ